MKPGYLELQLLLCSPSDAVSLLILVAGQFSLILDIFIFLMAFGKQCWSLCVNILVFLLGGEYGGTRLSVLVVLCLS